MTEQIREVYSLLIPIAGAKLMVPRTAVREVLGYSPPRDCPEDAPEWFLGMVGWEDDRAPLVSLEAALGRGVPETGRRTRITYLHALQGKLNPPVIALLTQGYPYLVRVTEGVLSTFDEPDFPDDAPILTQMKMANERPLVPDLDRLEDWLIDLVPAPVTE